MLAEAECEGGGEVVIVHGEPGETRAMSTDRAWAMVTMMVQGIAPRDAGAASRAWIWTKHAGCAYPPGSDLKRLVDNSILGSY